VSASKTSFNNPDATLTTTRTGGATPKVVAVFVLNQHGEPLMPCSPRKARVLLKNGKAKVVKRTPFVIQLNYSAGNAKQDVTIGVDAGYETIGLSAVSKRRELFSAEVMLRTDMVRLMSERRTSRKSRRWRKTWYRPTRFLNRTKIKGWLAPSIQHKADSHIKIIKWIYGFLPIQKIRFEVANFDIQKIKNPDINNEQYQEGEQYGFENIKKYILFRDNHICQYCKGKSGDKILNVHHIESRTTGGDRPANLITLCKTCHKEYHDGKIRLQMKITKNFRAEAFMNLVRWKMIAMLKTIFNNVQPTFGYITSIRRRKYGVLKSHTNDAFIIAEGTTQERGREYLIKQVRRCNRKLFNGKRSHVKNIAPRFIGGFQRYDKVSYDGIECFIMGRRITGFFELRKLDGTKISSCANIKKIKLLESFKTFLVQDKINFNNYLEEGKK
jgi:N6-L-threonylcarbamoyladenine synthase